MPTRLQSTPRKVASTATACTNPLHVLIVGASLGGLALAHGLRRKGVSCSLYEARRSYPSCRPGYQVAIDPMGSQGLRECLPPDLFAAFLAEDALAPRHRRRRAGLLEERLRQLLLTGLADRVDFGKEFTHHQQQADGTVTAFFADGGSASGQVLVAADGTHSAVRAQYLRELIPKRHLNLRRFCPATNPASGFPLQVTASELAPAWQATNVTLIGDAIHAVTPGPPVGANTALRDAMLLTRALSFVRANRIGLRNAVAAYETEMIRFEAAGVIDRCCPG
jgi:2-polyprenyl-6-methoxyphenol hydroxylase-like FAD-dependent oxidoreductase